MTLKDILAEPPKVHNWGSGMLTSSGLPSDVFKFIYESLTPASKTVETGMGISTAVFALSKCRHTCISPDAAEIERLREYAEKNNLETSQVEFFCNRSCDKWFDLVGREWDLVLIDGSHGFPAPVLDWYFLTQGLKTGGYCIIDDIHISTGKQLVDFLLKEEEWELMPVSGNKTAVFRKLGAYDYNKEFMHQPYVLSETRKLNKYASARNRAGAVMHKFRKIFSGVK